MKQPENKETDVIENATHETFDAFSSADKKKERRKHLETIRKEQNRQSGLIEFQKDLVVGRFYRVESENFGNVVGELTAKKQGMFLINPISTTPVPPFRLPPSTDKENWQDGFFFNRVKVYEISREKAFEISQLQ